MKNRTSLESKIEKLFREYSAKGNEVDTIKSCLQKRGYLPGAAFNIVRCGTPLSELTDEELYWIYDALSHLYSKEYMSENMPEGDYFSAREVQTYKSSTIKRDFVEYPIQFDNMIKVSSDQWIGTITSSEIKKLYDSQIINYNPATQRQMKESKRAGETRFKISLSQKKVGEICACMKRGIYIPDEITLNANEDNPLVDWGYEENIFELKSGQFDIIDGYHRYMSIIRCMEDDPSFNIVMQVKICAFTEEKARRFIVQKDLQTPMKKDIVSAYAAGEIPRTIAEKINQTSLCPLYGKLYQNNTFGIDFNAFVTAIGYYKSNIEKTKSSINSVALGLSDLISDYYELSHDFSKKSMYFIVAGYFHQKTANDVFYGIEYTKETIKPYLKPNILINRINKYYQGETEDE